MGRLDNRVSALEARNGVHDIYKHPFHIVIQRVGQSRDEALDVYGRERIGPHDRLIVVRLVEPKFDANGRMIPQQPNQQPVGL